MTVDLPAVDSNPPVATFDEDIAVVRNAVLKELDAGHDVVVNAHSWGAVPTNSALDGLSKLEREKEGKSNSVVKLTFVAAFVLPAGVTLEEACGGPVDWWIIADVSNAAHKCLLILILIRTILLCPMALNIYFIMI